VVCRLERSQLERDVLAGGLVGTEGGGLDGGRGLVVLVGLLDQKGDTALLAGNDTDSLFQHCQSQIPCHFRTCARRLCDSWWSYLVGDRALILRTISQLLQDLELVGVPCGCTLPSG
jgi:hypothetical protein